MSLDELRDRYECNTAIMHARTAKMNEYAAETKELKEKHVTQKAYYESVFEDGARRIAKLTEQRDVAIDALKTAKHGLVQWHVPENRYAALDAVNGVLATTKSSGAKK
jgi:hypothetical protein